MKNGEGPRVSEQPVKRLVELDFFRGLVLLVIVIDHIGGSILSRGTLHAYALCDAAEVFVFLGGFATATAYLGISERRTPAAARRRFLWRGVQLYRAYLVTAALMVALSAVLDAFKVNAPNLTIDDLHSFAAAPWTTLLDIALFKRQPYLSSVLPMYAAFAFLAAWVMPLMRRSPLPVMLVSVSIWAIAPRLAEYLPSATDEDWAFNPFAWQFIFALGALVRCHPVAQTLGGYGGAVTARKHRWGWLVTLTAFAIFAGCAYYKLRIETDAPDGDLKRNLDWTRLVNFLAVAWLCAELIRYGLIRKLAGWLPWVNRIGRIGLVCFIAGSCISLFADSMLYVHTDGLLNYPAGLLTDVLSLSALAAVAAAWEPLAKWFKGAWRALA
jgi:hypothetical protein